MSVRATERLIGDVVIAAGLFNSPRMIVQSVDVDTKLVKTIWFSDTHEGQEAVFPASALDRAGEKPVQGTNKPGSKGQKPRGKK
jgi:hypothetical protein